MRSFYDQPLTSLERYCAGARLPQIHARNLFRNAYKALRADPEQDERLPRALTAAFARDFSLPLPRVVEAHRSAYDHSVKLLLELSDGLRVESVIMPESQRLTLCISSQVGCAQACVFCHTGRMGLTRNLTAGEIVGQVVLADLWLAAHPDWPSVERRVGNVVFMGMGEPLDNVDAVADALSILTDPYGLALGLRRISVSTAGHLEGIERLVALVPNVRLALSVHSVDEQKRSKIMPINRRWPLASVISRLKELRPEGNGIPVMLQYTMIKGVNDSVEEAARLVELMRGLEAKVNLIPLNPIDPTRLVAPSPETIQAFRDVLHAAGVRVMVRYSKGQDIAAACGQLVVRA